jgi:hypothetical protein
MPTVNRVPFNITVNTRGASLMPTVNTCQLMPTVNFRVPAQCNSEHQVLP